MSESGYYHPKVLHRPSINLDNLIQICSKRIQKDPTHKKALYIRASSFVKKELFDQAIEDCNRLLGIDYIEINKLNKI
jgi:hypothetical protein